MILKVTSNPNDSVLLAGCVNPIPQHSGCVLELTGASGLDWVYRLLHTLLCIPQVIPFIVQFLFNMYFKKRIQMLIEGVPRVNVKPLK